MPSNPIRNKLTDHGAVGYGKIDQYEADLYKIYIRARNRIESELSTFLQQKGASFTGPRLVSLMDELNGMFPEFEEEYRDTYQEALSYMAKQNYATALHDMGLKENVVGSMDKSLFENMRDDAFTHIAGATQNMQKEVVSNLRRMSSQVMREATLTGATRAEVSRRLAAETLYGRDSIYQQGPTGPKPGSFAFVDVRGRKWKNNDYFEMLGRTLLHNNARECYLSGCAKSGSDIVTVSISGDPCEKCIKWENVLLSISGKTSGLPTVQQAIDDGLCHPRCRHRFVAVPEVIAQEYYDKHGKPVEGINSEGGEPVEPTKVYLSESGRREDNKKHRNEQWNSAFDNRRDKWHKSIIDAGASKEIAAEMADIYTPEMANLGKPPKVIVDNATNPGYNNTTGILTLQGKGSVSDNVHTARHEMGHWWQYRMIKKNPEFENEIIIAGESDWKRIQDRFKGRMKDFKLPKDETLWQYGELKDHPTFKLWKERIFLNGTTSTSPDEEHSLINFFDTIGSISDGQYGGGHFSEKGDRMNYYERQNIQRVWFGEAVANLHDELKTGSSKVALAFPNLSAILKKNIKGL